MRSAGLIEQGVVHKRRIGCGQFANLIHLPDLLSILSCNRLFYFLFRGIRRLGLLFFIAPACFRSSGALRHRLLHLLCNLLLHLLHLPLSLFGKHAGQGNRTGHRIDFFSGSKLLLQRIHLPKRIAIQQQIVVAAHQQHQAFPSKLLLKALIMNRNRIILGQQHIYTCLYLNTG
ncbi:hypothetical protein D3C75_642730 [compost metagenome]